MSRVLGDLSTLGKLKSAIRHLPVELGTKVAASVAPKIDELARRTFNASENAYGDPWEPGAQGQTVTLRKTGRLAEGVRYVAIGTTMRAKLGPGYAKWQVGKRPIFPRGKLPIIYRTVITNAAFKLIREQMTRER